MKISVAITTYNRSCELQRAIDSVLAQDYPNFEIVVLDDCSSDNTMEMVTSYVDDRVYYHKNEINLGPRKNIRKVIDYCSGDLIVFLNDDDYYTDQHFFYDVIDNMTGNTKMYCASAQVFDAYKNTTTLCEMFKEGIIAGDEYIRGYLTMYEKPVSTFTSIISLTDFKKSSFMKLQELDDNLILLIGFSLGDVVLSKKSVGVYRFGDFSVSSTLGQEFIKNNIDGLEFLYQEFKKMEIVESTDWLRQQILILGSFVASVKNTSFNNMRYMFGRISKLDISQKMGVYMKLISDYVVSSLRQV